VVDASTAPPAVAAAVPGFVAVDSSSAADHAARRPARPLKRSRKDQAAEAAGLSVGAQAVGLLRTSTQPTLLIPPPPPPPRVCKSAHPDG